MKKIILILLFASTGIVKNVYAQGAPNYETTVAYLKSIEDNKAAYIGQPFSVLLSSLQMEIKIFSPLRGIHYDISKETATMFGFYFPLPGEKWRLSFPRLRISWQPYLNAMESELIWDNNNAGRWVPAATSFYANGIIKNITVFK